jgi:hypothetical protein
MTCRKCGSSNPVSGFQRNASKSGGYANICTTCHNKWRLGHEHSPYGLVLKKYRSAVGAARKSEGKDNQYRVTCTSKEWLDYALPIYTTYAGRKVVVKKKVGDWGPDNVVFVVDGQPIQVLSNLNYQHPPEKVVDPLLESLRREHKELVAGLNNKQVKFEKGYVYVLTHPLFDGLVKIGKARDPFKRLDTYQTGDPLRRYKLHGYVYFPRSLRAEKRIHRILAKYCISENSEWFEMDVDEALALIKAESVRESNLVAA